MSRENEPAPPYTSGGWGRTTIASLASDSNISSCENPDHHDVKHGEEKEIRGNVQPEKAFHGSDVHLPVIEGTGDKRRDADLIEKIRQKRREAWGLSNFQPPEEDGVGRPKVKEALIHLDVSTSSPRDSSQSEKGPAEKPSLKNESRQPRRDLVDKESHTDDTEGLNSKQTVESRRKARIQEAMASVNFKKH